MWTCRRSYQQGQHDDVVLAQGERSEEISGRGIYSGRRREGRRPVAGRNQAAGSIGLTFRERGTGGMLSRPTAGR